MSKIIIGWCIVIIVVVISLTISLRDIVFNEQPFNATNFMIIILSTVTLIMYARVTGAHKEKR